MGRLAYTADSAILQNGAAMPLAGFGTWELRGPACSDLVCLAVLAGVRHIDTARMYGNEEAVGPASGKAASRGRDSSSPRS